MKYTYLIAAALLIAVFACNKDDDDGTSYVPQTPEEDDAQIIAYALDSLDYGLTLEDLIPLGDDGVYIAHIEEGTGDYVAIDSTNIEVHYTGYYIPGGGSFETTQPDQPRLFNLAELMAGWQIGLKAMKRDGRAHLFIPSRQAYEQGNLHFTISLLGFTDASENHETYELGLINDYFDKNSITDVSQINDSANVFIQHLEVGTGIMPELKDSVIYSFRGVNIVTDSARHVGVDTQSLVDEMRDGFKMSLPLMSEGGKANVYVPSKRNATAVDVIKYEVTLQEVIVNEEEEE